MDWEKEFSSLGKLWLQSGKQRLPWLPLEGLASQGHPGSDAREEEDMVAATTRGSEVTPIPARGEVGGDVPQSTS